jgi:2-polyprenyl-6-methoxyphenol hydroxylase-like FAD-dependent oxidoreductase
LTATGLTGAPTAPVIFSSAAARDRFSDTPDQKVTRMRELAAVHRGPWEEIREDITDPDRINYTRFEHLLIQDPWNRGRAVVIGDAAHVCPPTLALGAAMAIEDAVVLADILIAPRPAGSGPVRRVRGSSAAPGLSGRGRSMQLATCSRVART